MSRRRKTRAVEIDPRTENMSNTALICRADGHLMERIPLGPARRAELARLGQVEKVMVCRRGCGRTTTRVFDIAERIQVGAVKSSPYEEGYLIPREYAGHGRLSRFDAFIASLVRDGDL